MITALTPFHRTIIVATAWLGLVLCGLAALAGYAAIPGEVGQPPQEWPAEDIPPEITLATDAHTIVVAVHPRCPCTRATISELDRSLTNASGVPAIYALIFEPAPGELEHTDEAFARTRIAKRMGQLPNARLIPDPGSAIAQRFGALTSGHTLVYDSSGSLVFSGGMTPTRAHEGPNTGSSSLVRLLSGESAVAETAPVYGCPLCHDGPSLAFDVCSTQEEQP